MADSGIVFGDTRHGDQMIDATSILRAPGKRYLRPRVDLGGFTEDASFLTAFGGITAQPETPIPNMQLSFPYNINDVYSTVTVLNGGTVTQANGQAVLQSSAAVNGSALLESVGAARYTPGQGQVTRFTAVFTTGVANSRQEIGIGDAVDGYFFGYDGATFGLFRRQNSANTFVAQTAWNVDKMDGTGPSGMTLDPTKGNVYSVRYQWLGYGAIRYYIEDAATGLQQLVHTIRYANANVVPSVFNPSLPLHARVFNSGNASNITMRVGSMGAYSEGPFNSYGGRFSTGNRKTGITTELAVLSIRCDSTVFGGAPNRARLHIDALSTAISGNADSLIRLVLNPTLGGVPAFAALDANRSIVSIDAAGTTVTNGREIRRICSTGNFQETQDLSALEIRLNPGDVLTFAASSFGAAIAANVGPAWNEEA